jgi:hypothetical protein
MPGAGNVSPDEGIRLIRLKILRWVILLDIMRIFSLAFSSDQLGVQFCSAGRSALLSRGGLVFHFVLGILDITLVLAYSTLARVSNQ